LNYRRYEPEYETGKNDTDYRLIRWNKLWKFWSTKEETKVLGFTVIENEKNIPI